MLNLSKNKIYFPEIFIFISCHESESEQCRTKLERKTDSPVGDLPHSQSPLYRVARQGCLLLSVRDRLELLQINNSR